MGFKTRMYAAPSALLRDQVPGADVCLVLDVNLPEMSGPALDEMLKDSGRRLPTVYITGDMGTNVEKILQRPDAPEVLFKPIRVEALVGAIERAFTSGTFR
jgi:two-component system, LuxR family, response regulator FixJ